MNLFQRNKHTPYYVWFVKVGLYLSPYEFSFKHLKLSLASPVQTRQKLNFN